MPNTTTMITVSNLHKMHLTQGDDEHWVRGKSALIPPSPIREGSSIVKGPTKASRLSNDS